jgi:hypothetical protein
MRRDLPTENMINKSRIFLNCFFGIVLLCAVTPIWAGYKPRPWTISAREAYPAQLTSERVTIAVQPLFTDALAARVFDKLDMVTRGIMPLAVIIYNDNEFPVEVDGLSIELIHDLDHVRSLSPNEVVTRLFKKDKNWMPRVPTSPRSEINADALDDFDAKFLMQKTVAPHSQEAGFLYLHIPDSSDLVTYLSTSFVYIPKIYRQDTGSRMIFFEIGLNAAIPPAPKG